MLDILIKNISKTTGLSSKDIELCAIYFESITLSRHTIVAEQGKIPNYLYFISSGFTRLFYDDENGDEKTTYFSGPEDFIASFLSFINQANATENLETITDCELLRISHANMKKLIDESENFKLFSLTIFQKAIASTTSRANDLATLNAEQRYKKLIQMQPELIKNIPVQYIASYLGIQPESLSRIRRQMIS